MIKQIADNVVSSFNDAPVLLLIVVLNIVAMGAGVYFLIHMDKTRSRNAEQMVTLLSACILQSSQDQRE